MIVMQAVIRSGKKYVQALVEAATERGQAEQVGKSLRRLQAVAEKLPELVATLRHPELDEESKLQLLNWASGGEQPALVRGFLDLLIRDEQADILRHVADLYEELCDELHGIQRVLVETPIPLDDAQKQRLQVALEKIVGSQVRLDEQINPEILGGLRISLGHRVIDASLQGRLEALRQAVG